MPPSFKTETEVVAWLSRYISRDDVTSKLNHLKADVRDAIKQKKIIEGMQEEEMRMSWGIPTEVIHLGDTQKQKVINFASFLNT